MPEDERPPQPDTEQSKPTQASPAQPGSAQSGSAQPVRRPSEQRDSDKKDALAQTQNYQPQRGPAAEAKVAEQVQAQLESDEIRSGDASVPNFLAVFFVMFGLWGAWYFAFHLAPLDEPEPASVMQARPAVVRSYQQAAADPAVAAHPTHFDLTGEFSVFALTAPTAQLQGGAALFQGRCAQCHGSDGQGRAGPFEAATLQGDSLLWTLPPSRVAQLIKYGFDGLMPEWGNDQGQIALEHVVAYLSAVMAPAPGTPSPLEVTKGGVNVQDPINTFNAPWERADGVFVRPAGGGQ
ncbi:cytochrome c [Deinococcus detaillensis]|uniref:Cytochrome c n=1 Tax=Deinococcus detaillensis TaxID=2592048 RepID=A0A553UHT2_9DEIO|nr:cytochrome c [Deinococcus detaillensis]TSA79775.1 cytochrome c [Deinococcus detaillensis]